MSSDNGIYIGEFPTIDNKKEYRVIHAQAIDNCIDNCMDNCYDYSCVKDEIDKCRLSYFGKAKVFNNKNDAYVEALKIYKDYNDNGMYIEYGISELTFDRVLRLS